MRRDAQSGLDLTNISFHTFQYLVEGVGPRQRLEICPVCPTRYRTIFQNELPVCTVRLPKRILRIIVPSLVLFWATVESTDMHAHFSMFVRAPTIQPVWDMANHAQSDLFVTLSPLCARRVKKPSSDVLALTLLWVTHFWVSVKGYSGTKTSAKISGRLCTYSCCTCDVFVCRCCDTLVPGMLKSVCQGPLRLFQYSA